MISGAEAKVMDVLWRQSPRTADDIVAEIAEQQKWSAATVRTLLNRLVGKGAVATEKDGRRYLYSPVLSRDEYIATASEGMLDQLFGGRVGLLVSHFSDRRKLTPEDLEELKRLIMELDRGE